MAHHAIAQAHAGSLDTGTIAGYDVRLAESEPYAE